MRALSFLPLGLVVGCSNVVVSEALPAPEAVAFAIFDVEEASGDTDGDGVDDFTLQFLSMLLSDQEDLCEALEQDPRALEGLSDVQLVGVLGVSTVGSMVELGEYTTTTDATNAMLSSGRYIGATLVVREGGETTRMLRDSAGFGGSGRNDALLDIDAITNGAAEGPSNLDGKFSMTFDADHTDPEAFDTDSDGDGSPDYTAVSVDIEANFNRATICEALLEPQEPPEE